MVTEVKGAPLSGGLPAAPTGMSLADPSIQKQYSESVDKVLAALENRGDIPWFKISAAMADPGRTGSAAEGFGRAMGVLGQQQEENRARELPVAQMRAQLVGQKYKMGREAEALNAFAKVLGTTPQNLQSGMAQAQNNPAMMQRITAAMPNFYGSPEITELAKTMFSQHKDLANTLLEARKAGASEMALIQEYGESILPMLRALGGVQPTGPLPSGQPSGQPSTTTAPQGQFDFSPIVNNGQLTSQFGPRADGTHQGVDIGAKLNEPIRAPIAGEVVFAGNGGDKAGNMVTIRGDDGKLHSFMHMNQVGVKVGDVLEPSSVIGQVGATGNARGAHVHYEVKGADGKPFNPLDMFRVTPPAQSAGTVRTATEALGPIRVEADRVVAPDGEILAERGASPGKTWNALVASTVADFNKRKEETVKFEREQITNASKERTESFAPRIKEVGTINSDNIMRTQGLYDSLDNLVNNDPDMKKALGLMFKQGAGAAMYELAKSGVKVNNFGIGVDAYPAFVKQLSEPKQEKLRQMDMILSSIFIEKAQAGKSAFGPAISNFDILTQKEQMASIRDTAKIINSWLSQERALADQKLEIGAAFGDYVAATEGTNKKPYQFFTSQEYKDIAKKYGQLYRDLAITTYGAPK
jgi:murein DD-endopeptidase MepM/ murein hydrolase activator NlpD